jgi:coenzyme F420-dependent glucose-6-phosphate dehydrogenase
MTELKRKHLGYCAMFEQFHPNDLLDWCVQAEKLGFGGVMASDHFAPWVPSQGQSAFVWTWLGAYGARCGLPVGTAVTPPGYRFHPAVIAHMAATMSAMFPGKFWLGLGAGEALNEHILGDYWPEAHERVERLLEGIEVIRKLFTGKEVKHQGKHFKMESCRLWTMPETPPPILIASSGPVMSRNTGKLADGFITVGAADEKLKMLVGKFEEGAKSENKDVEAMPRFIQLHVSWAKTQEEAEENAVREWPNGGMNFAKADIRYPEVFEAIAKMVRPEHFKGRVFMSNDLDKHAEFINHFYDLGFDAVYVHNVGKNQVEFLEEYSRNVLPSLNLGSNVAVAK